MFTNVSLSSSKTRFTLYQLKKFVKKIHHSKPVSNCVSAMHVAIQVSLSSAVTLLSCCDNSCLCLVDKTIKLS